MPTLNRFSFPRSLRRTGAVLASTTLLGVAVPQLASAAGPGGPGAGDTGSTWGLGIAAISTQKPYAGMDRETRALPILQYENRWVRVFGPGVEVKLPSWDVAPGQQLSFGVVARWDGAGYEAKDAPILDGMAERKGGIWVGAKAAWRNDFAQLSTEWTADASSHSKGQRLNVTLEKTWRVGSQFMLTPRVAAVWQDKKYIDYYYGVRAQEVTAGRAAYAGQSALNGEVGLRGMYLFDRHHAVMVDVGVTGLASEIKDSPLVDRSTENRVMLGYLYRF